MSATLEFATIQEHAKLLKLPTLSEECGRFVKQAAREVQAQRDIVADLAGSIAQSKDAGEV